MDVESFRWVQVEEGEKDALFDADALAERHVGSGEFRGTEFLHVNTKRIISAVPRASAMPFRYTVNVYRGCSHACSYCLSGDTAILMGDGRTMPLAEVRKGDTVYGTVVDGAYRRYVATEVLDHWSTVEQAWRVVLADGTELVASADHRFLTSRGWKHVAGEDQGLRRRPHLTKNSKLMGPGGWSHTESADEECRRGYLCGMIRGDGHLGSLVGTALKSSARLEVVAVEPLDLELPLYDITTATGDFVANGVVSHNCFARPTHEYLGLGIGEDFERRIVVKVNAVERIRAELAARRWAGDHIAMGTNTDPYQRCEGKYHLTQGVVRALSEAANPFSILTKSTLILRDIDLLAEAAKHADVRVNLSIGTLDDEVWRRAEPGTPQPRAHVEAVRRLNAAGVPCGVLVAPILPGLSDGEDQLRSVVEACVAAGAVSISSVALHLRPGVREHYLSWLRQLDPALAAATEARYRRAYLPKAEQRELSGRVRAMVDAARPAGWRPPATSGRGAGGWRGRSDLPEAAVEAAQQLTLGFHDSGGGTQP